MKSLIFTVSVILLFLNLTSLALEVPFEATDNEGNILIGTVTELDAGRLVLDSDGTKSEITVDKLIKLQSLYENPFLTSLREAKDVKSFNSSSNRRRINEMEIIQKRKNATESPDDTKTAAFPEIVSVLELKDGSRLTVTEFSAKGKIATCILLNSNNISLPLNQIHAVRLVVKGLTEVSTQPDDWRKLANKSEKGDRIVIGQPGSLDVYVGILAEVGKETISFIVDGETLPVPRRKVFGLLFHTPENAQTAELQNPLASLTLWNGTSARLLSLKLDENANWNWTTISGVSGTFLADEIDELNFGQKNVFYLTELKPAVLEQALCFDRETKQTATDLPIALFRTFRISKILLQNYDAENELPVLVTQLRNDSRKNSIPDQPIPHFEGFVLDGVFHKNGLTIPAKTILEYTLTEPFTTLQTVAGIDERLCPNGEVQLRIQANQQLLGQWRFRGDKPTTALKLNLPPGTKTLKFEVDFPDGISPPAILTLADPKLLK